MGKRAGTVKLVRGKFEENGTDRKRFTVEGRRR
jgi:hypothetical protein